MNWARCIIAGLLVGLVGAVIWAIIAAGAHREIGWIAWGIGALVGVVVRLTAGERIGPATGITAVAIALLAIVSGKYLAAALTASQVKITVQVTATDIIQSLARDVVQDWQAKGRKLQWPPGKDPQEAAAPQDFPRGVWDEAVHRWQQLGAEEQRRRIDQKQAELNVALAELVGNDRNKVFAESFSAFDILWFLLATLSAFRLGAGALGGSK